MADPADAGQGAAEPSSAYPLALMWIAPAARPQQRQQLRELLKQLADAARQEPAQAERIAGLRQELASMPVTGRVPLPAHDLAWLQAHPTHDPVLAEGDEWWLPMQPGIVRVMLSSGERCDVRFQPGAPALRYLQRCAAVSGELAPLEDSAFVIQPDGRVQAIGIAPWNAQLQASPAPGAWIWSARRDSGLGASVQQKLAEWLATQGAAGSDPVPTAERLPVPDGTPAARESALPQGLIPGGVPLPEPPTHRASAAPEPRPSAPARDLPVLASDWGVSGLLQTPTARTREAGAFGLVVSRTMPYTQVSLLMSPLDSVEIAVRYTNVGNLRYGVVAGNDQGYKDKSAEIKWRLLDEGRYTPALALGLRDPGGTGLFAGEYLVASKRWGDFDISLGLGWGYLGGRADLANPLAPLGERFQDRQRGQRSNTGGTANLGAMFTGRTAVFGGVQWHSPWDDLVFRLELDGNDYRHEFGGRLEQDLPINAGVSWRWGDAELSLAWQRGRQWSFNLAWIGSLPRLGMAKVSLPRPPAVEPPLLQPPQPQPPLLAVSAEPAPAAVAPQARPAEDPAVASLPNEAALRDELAQHSGWHATRLVIERERWTAHFDQAGGAYVRERIERIWAVLHREAPPEVTAFALELASRQLPLVRHEVDRIAWADARSRHLARHQQASEAAAELARAPQEPQVSGAFTPAPEGTPRLATGINLGFQQHLGGPDGYLYAFSLRAFGQLRAWSGAWLQGNLQLRLLDNYDGFTYTAPSELPRVRTHMREFVTTSRVTIPNLQFNQTARLGEGLYALAYAGWLEPMFAGVGAELLWRPLNSRWAVGLDLNLVRKRDFEQDLGLQDYEVKTGHLTVRWDTGWHDWVAGVSIGQYLAGDRGLTVDLARVFPNGTRMGLWATKTNVSAAQFGEGSFDKGLYLTVPFDAMFSSWSGSAMTVAWQPLIRDGGAKLQRGASLWGLTDVRDLRIMEFRSAGPESKLE